MDESRQWHRLFGLSLMDFFHGTPVVVEVEKDLSLKQQWLDVVLLRKQGELTLQLPDGFEVLAPHNLLTFKSYQETLDDWALEELVGHYVNYRKQVSPSMQNLLPAEAFRLFAVCVRFPQGLAGSFTLEERSAGVYDIRRFGGWIRLIVVNRLPQEEQNALLHLFSAQGNQVLYGAGHYHLRSSEASTVLLQLFQRYREEGVPMPYTMEEFVRESLDRILKSLSTEERLKGVPAEERLKGVPTEERLKGVPAEDRLKGLPLEEVVRALPPEYQAALRALDPQPRQTPLSEVPPETPREE